MRKLPGFSRHRAIPALAGAVAITAAAALALPAVAAPAGPDAASGVAATTRASSVTKTTTLPRTSTRRSSSSSTNPSTPRPHCTGCVEHQVFGFEDGTPQNWLPYGASGTVTDGQPTATDAGAATAGLPRTGRKMLTVTGMGNATGIRWSGTKDIWLSRFQVRVWVRSHSRSGTLALTVSGGQKYARATAYLEPGVWTPIVTPSTYMGGNGMPVITLSQTDFCENGNIGAIDIDDTAVASSFDSEPAVWQADNSSLLADPLPQMTPSLYPCQSTTTTPSTPTVVDFENRSAQGWQGQNSTGVKVAKAAALNGKFGLRLIGSKAGVSAQFTTPLTAFAGSGDWYRVRVTAAGNPTISTVDRCFTTTKSATVTLAAEGAEDATRGWFLVTEAGSTLEYWFRPAANSTQLALSVTSPLAKLSLDDVTLDRASSVGTATPTDTTTMTVTPRTGKCKQSRS